MPLVSRTRATLRSAEFGFLGVVVYTRVQTPRRCGGATFFLRPLPDFRPGVASFLAGFLRPLFTSWLVVGMRREKLAAVRRLPDAGDHAGTPARGTSTLASLTPPASPPGASVPSPAATLTPSLRPGLSATAP